MSEQVSRAVEFVAAHYSMKLTTETIARECNISRSRLAHIFPAQTGRTVAEYVRLVRVSVAKRLLAERRMKLSKLAAMSGFCDAPHLSRVFRGVTGHYPSAYRRHLEILLLSVLVPLAPTI
jgi:transcriptional regulator GlxA family with amidase domain